MSTLSTARSSWNMIRDAAELLKDTDSPKLRAISASLDKQADAIRKWITEEVRRDDE